MRRDVRSGAIFQPGGITSGSPVIHPQSVAGTNGNQGEHQQGAPEGLHLGITESQGRGALRFDPTRSVDLLEGFFCHDAVVVIFSTSGKRRLA